MSSFVWSLIMVAAAPAAADQPSDPKKQTVCKREASIESRIPKKRVCKTREEWQAMSKDAQDAFDDAMGRIAATPPQ